MTAAFEQVAMGLDASAAALRDSANEPGAIRLLLIGDGAVDRGFLVNELSKQGFAVRTVASLAGTPDAVGDADVIVLHCDWTKVSRIELLDKLQRQTASVPIVLLTGEASTAHEDVALDKLPIDVVGKSRGSEVLARRLQTRRRGFRA
jgi:DNA-binding response OmpR family regulator